MDMNTDNISKQALVDYAIQLYERGEHRDAYQLMSDIGFNTQEADRVFKYPEKRKSYINDYITGF